MSRRKLSRRRGRETEALITARVERIDRLLSRFYEDLAKSDLKLSDYARLAELESIAVEDGEEEVIVRWVSYKEETDEA